MNPEMPMQQQEPKPEPIQPVDSGGEDLLAVGVQINLKNRLKKLGISGGVLALIGVLVVLFFVAKIFLPKALVRDQTAFEQTGDKTQREDTWVLDIPRNDVLIRMNNGIYTPNNLTMEVGMTVAFANEDTEAEYWPQSASHPELIDLPSAIPPGAFYSFTATKLGKITFTDQLHLSSGGAITVKPVNE